MNFNAFQRLAMYDYSKTQFSIFRAAARALIGGGGGEYSFFRVIRLISKEISRAQHKNRNIHPPISALATALSIFIAKKLQYICAKNTCVVACHHS